MEQYEIDGETDRILAEIADAEQDVIADMGEEAVERGGYVEIIRGILAWEMPDERVRREVLRRTGLDYDVT